MRKFTVFLCMILFSILGYSQGHETFDNFELSGNSYQDGEFIGQDGSTWEYLQSRGDYEVNGSSLMLGRNRTPNSQLVSGTISGGIGTLQFSFMQSFTNNVNMEVYINDELVYTATTSNEIGVVKTTEEIEVNVEGDFVFKFYNLNGAGQVNIDDIIWTAYENEDTDPEPESPCDSIIVMDCGVEYTADLIPNSGYWQNYSGVTVSYKGSEQVFEFTAEYAGAYHFVLNQGSADADFIVMDACSNVGNNLSGGYWSGTASELLDLTAGQTIYLIADLYSSTNPTTVSVKIECSMNPADCEAVDVPYVMDFESAIPPMLPDCTSSENLGSGNGWRTYNGTSSGFSGTFLRYSWNSSNPANTWFYTHGINLEAGETYKISYDYGGVSTSYTEKMKVAYGTSPESSAMTTILDDHPNINHNYPVTNEVIFTPDESGVYYFGFHAYSGINQYHLQLDNIEIVVYDGTTDPDPEPEDCEAANVPYIMDFETAVTPDIPECTSIENVGSGNNWNTFTGSSYGFTGTFLRYAWHGTNPANAWFYTQGINLEAGETYKISYDYGGTGTYFDEKLKVAYGTAAESTAMTTILADHPNVINDLPLTNEVTFTPDTSGVYYFGFNAYSNANKFYLHVDNIEIVVYDETTDPDPEPEDCSQGIPSFSTIPNAFGIKASDVYRVAEDFFVEEGTTFTMTTITIDMNQQEVPDYVEITIYENNNGQPGNVIETIITSPDSSEIVGSAFGDPIHHLTFNLDSPLELEAGTYWLSPIMSTPSGEDVWWAATDLATHGVPALASNTSGAFWTQNSENLHMIFTVSGICEGETTIDPEPESPCDSIIVMECGVEYTADLELNSGYWSNYSGTNLSYPGSEQVFEFTAEHSATYHFILDQGEADADFFVMDACSNTANNLVGTYWSGLDNRSLYLTEGQTIYIIADLYSSASAPTTVSIKVHCPMDPSDCEAVDVPYIMDFESAIVPILPDCTSTENLGSGNDWLTYNGTSNGFSGTFLRYSWHGTNPANTWFYTHGINLEAGETYKISYDYGGTSTVYTEKMKVAYGTSRESSAMTTILDDHPNINHNYPVTNEVIFTPDESGVYYFGFHAYSGINQYHLQLDNIEIVVYDETTDPDPEPTEYCEPELDCTDGDVITNVTFQEINNNTACSPNGYGDYTSMEANVAAGGTYPISVTVGNGWPFESVSVWIDFDNSGTFDQDEFFFIGTGSNETLTGDITIPANLADGSYRMRVRVVADGEFASTYDMACDETQVYGETEDYTVQVGELGVSDLSSFDFAYYPNPVRDVLNITSQKTVQSVEVYNLTGQKVMAENKVNQDQIDVSKLAAGTYVFRVTLDNGKVETFKIIKK